MAPHHHMCLSLKRQSGRKLSACLADYCSTDKELPNMKRAICAVSCVCKSVYSQVGHQKIFIKKSTNSKFKRFSEGQIHCQLV